MRFAILIAVVMTTASFYGGTAHAQRVVFDRYHFQAVSENFGVRMAAENTHNQYLEKINDNLQDINYSAGTLVLAQTMIYRSLSNVNSALKNGLAIKNIITIINDINSNTANSLQLAKQAPYLLLTVEAMNREIKERALLLFSDVSEVILKEGDNMLADYNARDELLKMVTNHLQIMNALAYGAWRAMFWAKQQGIIKSLNPFAAYINTDKLIVEDIIRKTKYLKQ